MIRERNTWRLLKSSSRSMLGRASFMAKDKNQFESPKIKFIKKALLFIFHLNSFKFNFFINVLLSGHFYTNRKSINRVGQL